MGARTPRPLRGQFGPLCHTKSGALSARAQGRPTSSYPPHPQSRAEVASARGLAASLPALSAAHPAAPFPPPRASRPPPAGWPPWPARRMRPPRPLPSHEDTMRAIKGKRAAMLSDAILQLAPWRSSWGGVQGAESRKLRNSHDLQRRCNRLYGMHPISIRAGSKTLLSGAHNGPVTYWYVYVSAHVMNIVRPGAIPLPRRPTGP